MFKKIKIFVIFVLVGMPLILLYAIGKILVNIGEATIQVSDGLDKLWHSK